MKTTTIIERRFTRLMIDNNTVLEFSEPYVPEGGIEKVQTTRDVLVNTKLTLEEEGRWIQQTWYTNPHAEVDLDDPFCNSWAACLDGMIGAASVGAARQIYTGPRVPQRLHGNWDIWHSITGDRKVERLLPEFKLYHEAQQLLRAILRARGRFDPTIPNFNDASHTKRPDVIKLVQDGIDVIDAVAAGLDGPLHKPFVNIHVA